jgi:AraC-like DNA-binding protein
VADDEDRAGLVLPDGCTDLIWTQGRGTSVAGPDTGPVRTTMAAGTVIVGARFRPSAGGPALGMPLSELRDQRVDLADLRPADARRLSATLDPAIAADRLLDVTGARPDLAVARAARLLHDPRARAEDVADDIGLSLRQLRRRCHDAVGYGPKTLQRVLRFRRFVSRIDALPPDPADADLPGPDLASLAAQAGYADQAHLTRECGRLAGLTPAALARLRAAA